MSRVKRFKLTTAHDRLIEVDWLPDGLRIRVDGTESEMAPFGIGEVFEYHGVFSGICPLAHKKER